MSTKAYRLRIRDSGDSSWESTFTDIRFQSIPAPRVRVLDGRVESAPWSVEVLDASATFVDAMTDGTNYNLMRRKADMSVSEDGGAYSVLATGRITEIEMAQNRAFFRVTVHDERTIERQSDIFGTDRDDLTTTAVWAPGLYAAYRDFTVGPVIESRNPFSGDPFDISLAAQYVGRIGVVTTIKVTPSGAELPPQVRSAVNNDVLPGQPSIVTSDDLAEQGGGCFKTLRASIDGDEYEVVAFVYEYDGTQTGWRVGRAPMDDLPEGPLHVALYDPSNAVATSIASGSTFYLYFKNALPSKESPLHIDTVDLGTLIKNVYSGIYGGEAVTADTTTALGTYNPSTNPTGLVDNPKFPEVAFRIKSKANMAKWLEEHVYAPFGILPLVNASGEVAPTPVLLPAVDQVANVNTLFEFNASNSRLIDGQVFRQTSDGQVTVLVGKYTEEQWSTLEDVIDGTAGIDRIREAEKTTDDYSTENVTTYGRHVRELNLTGLHDADRVAEVMDRMKVEIGDRFEHGPITTKVAGLSATSSVAVADYVTINYGSYPDVDGTRGAYRLMQVIGIETRPAERIYTLLDAGPKSQPLSAPTLSASAQGKNRIRVTISGLGAGEGYILQGAKNASEPAEGSNLWKGITVGQNESVDVGGLPSGTKFYFRAMARAPGRIRSQWSTAVSATTDSMTAPTIVHVTNITATSAVLRFTVGEVFERIRVKLDGTTVADLPPKSKLYKFTNLAASTLYSVAVQHVDAYGGTAEDTDSFTTTAAVTTLTKPNSIQIIEGANVGTRLAT